MLLSQAGIIVIQLLLAIGLMSSTFLLLFLFLLFFLMLLDITCFIIAAAMVSIITITTVTILGHLPALQPKQGSSLVRSHGHGT